MNDTELQSIISNIVRRVLNENGANIPPGGALAADKSGRVLVAICCDGCLSNEARTSLEALESDFQLTRLPEEEFKKRSVRDRLVAEHDIILMPAVCYDMAAKMAMGTFDEPTALVALSALALGKPLVATVNTHYDEGLRTHSPVLRKLFEGHRRQLSNYGFEVVPAGDIAAAVRAHSAPSLPNENAATPALNGKRQLVTAEDIDRLSASGNRLQLPAGALVTPLARDRAKELGLEL